MRYFTDRNGKKMPYRSKETYAKMTETQKKIKHPWRNAYPEIFADAKKIVNHATN